MGRRVHVRICATMQFSWIQLPMTLEFLLLKKHSYTELPYSLSQVEMFAPKKSYILLVNDPFRTYFQADYVEVWNRHWQHHIFKVQSFVNWWRSVQLISPVLVAYRFFIIGRAWLNQRPPSESLINPSTNATHAYRIARDNTAISSLVFSCPKQLSSKYRQKLRGVWNWAGSSLKLNSLLPRV